MKLNLVLINNKFLKINFIIILILISVGFSQKRKERRIDFFSSKDFRSLFPNKNKFYSYESFIKAINELALIRMKIEKRGDWIYKITRINKGSGESIVVRIDKDWNQPWAKNKPYTFSEIDFGDFCSDEKNKKKELAAFFAHISHETRNGINGKYDDGLMLTHEVDTNSTYMVANLIYPAKKNKKYYGRGPLQISYNGNYGSASEAIFGDKNILLDNPDLVTINSIISFKTAIFFWMMPQSQKPSAHSVIIEKWQPTDAERKIGYAPGFGMTINIINGSLECNLGENQMAMNDRINFYKHFLKSFKMNDEKCPCSCGKMPPYTN